MRTCITQIFPSTWSAVPPYTVHDPVVVHRVRHTPVPDGPGHRQPAVPPTKNRALGAGARAGCVHHHDFRSHVLGQAGRVPVGAHKNPAEPNRQQDVPQPVHTDAHPRHTVLHRHDHGLGAAQNEKLVL